MKRNNRWTPLLLLVALPLLLGCPGIKAPVLPGEADPYTLRIVFSGLVPLVPSDETTSPDALWALIPNLEDPSHLHLGSGIHAHKNRLLFDPAQVEIDAGGRKVETDGWACACDDTEETLSYVVPGADEPEHLRLSVFTPETSLRMNRGPIQLPAPCDPNEPGCDVQGRSIEDQARDVRWAVNVDGVLEELFGTGNPRPVLRPGVLKPAYEDGNGDTPLVKVRYRFDRGLLQAGSLHRVSPPSCTNEFAVFTIAPPEEVATTGPLLQQAISRELELVLQVRGDVAFAVSDLTDPTAERPPIVFRPKRGHKEVVLRIDNEPDVESCTELVLMAMNPPESADELHFVSLYNLLDEPDRLPTPTLARSLSPSAPDQTASHNAQCSPITYRTQ